MKVLSMNLIRYIERQKIWSTKAFGPGARVGGITKHIEKELVEVRADPKDVEEWIDIVILALDGAWRSGASTSEIALALEEKQIKNAGRVWPDWRRSSEDQAIEHVKGA